MIHRKALQQMKNLCDKKQNSEKRRLIATKYKIGII